MQPDLSTRTYAPRRPSVTLPCDLCGTPVTITASHARAYKTHCCSRRCRDLLTGQNRRVDPLVRFWVKVDKNGPVPPLTPELGACWSWTGATILGYGAFQVGNRKQVKAHHYAWMLAEGTPRPFGAFIGHVCDNPPCVRNDTTGTYDVDGVTYERHGHLWLAGTNLANTRDRSVKGRTTRLRSPLFSQHGVEKCNAKLNEDIVRTIRSLYASGVKQVDIAAQFDIHQSHVSSIIRRASWAHVE